METWKKFEIEATQYLNDNLKDKAIFVRQGGADSTIPDISVTTLYGDSFYIEAKHCPAQCGQFVLLPNLRTQEFDYSPLNATKLNTYTQQIIDVMNARFNEYKEAGTAGKNIQFSNSQNVFSNWIITTYKSKGVKFIITNNFKIFSIDDFSDIFKITAKYRVKRSGSTSVGKSKLEQVKSYLIANYSIIDTRESNDKLFVFSNENLHNIRFYIDGNEYMISKRDEEYEIRKLSNTFNANVIFSIEIKDDSKCIPINVFASKF